MLEAYNPTEWNTDDVITKEKLNKIENGIKDVSNFLINKDYIRGLFPAVETAGNIVSIENAVPAPPDELKWYIEPLQNLHGYNNPWPNGGNTNKFGPNNDEEEGKYIKADGSIATASDLSWNLSGYIAVEPNTEYTFTPNTTVGSTAKHGYYTSGKELISTIDSGPETFTTPSNCYFMRFSYRSTSTNIQLVKGSTTVDYVPYANICPITGYTSMVGARCRTNLIDFTEVLTDGWSNEIDGLTAHYNNGIMTVTGTSTATGWTLIADFKEAWVNNLKMFPSGTYIGSTNIVWRARVDGADRKNISGAIVAEQALSIEGFYIAVQAGATVDWSIPMMFVSGSTRPTEYEAYVGSIYPVTFPAEAGTVYGGYVDAVNGKLVVDRVLESKKWGSLTFAQDLGANTRKRFVFAYTPKYTMIYASGDLKCNMIGVYNASYGTDNVHMYIANTVYAQVFLPSDTDADTDVQLSYSLATPTEYDIDPVTVELLRGNNMLWCDTGDTEMTYRQDVATLLSALTRPDESDHVASAPIANDAFFMMNGTLYRATTAITSGETISPGSNCVATSIAEQLNAIYSQLT